MTEKISKADRVRVWIVVICITAGGFIDGSVQL